PPPPARRVLLSVSCSSPRRDLHSFPTRRSSDLSPELSRRASIDLLRAELPAIGLKSLDDADSAGLTSSARAPSEAAILRTLEERSEEHTSELQSRENLVCRLLLEKKKQRESPSR